MIANSEEIGGIARVEDINVWRKWHALDLSMERTIAVWHSPLSTYSAEI
ncbi:MAG: hypothetical protein M1454_05200 [Candidatus Thermoplasmatota archaeon]|nr:hypothetical protein [Candidatus Thermoplasmatota archaeon]